jgi:hypothetical protein
VKSFINKSISSSVIKIKEENKGYYQNKKDNNAYADDCND